MGGSLADAVDLILEGTNLSDPIGPESVDPTSVPVQSGYFIDPTYSYYIIDGPIIVELEPIPPEEYYWLSTLDPYSDPWWLYTLPEEGASLAIE